MTIVYMKTYMHPTERERIFAIMRHNKHGMAQIAHMLTLLREAARLLPDYAAFQALCRARLRQAWGSDRLQSKGPQLFPLS